MSDVFLNIWNAFESFKMRLKHLKRVLNIITVFGTVADTCHIFFFFFFFWIYNLATRLEYKAVEILVTRFEYYKRVLNIRTRLNHN